MFGDAGYESECHGGQSKGPWSLSGQQGSLSLCLGVPPIMAKLSSRSSVPLIILTSPSQRPLCQCSQEAFLWACSFVPLLTDPTNVS